MTTTLQGRVAVVTGASRGIGKGIALELGAAGAIVYLTARSVEPGPIPGTVGETVAEIEALGGTAVGVACDHHDDAQVAALFARVEREHSRLDVLVNNVYSAIDLAPWLGKPFWDEGLGTDAVRTLCRFGFRHMNLQRIELDVFETNPRALRAYEKVGFTLEGTRRRSEFVQGRHVGSHIMGLLVEDLIDD